MKASPAITLQPSAVIMRAPLTQTGREDKKMIEDKATERWKERARKLGLIVNAGADKFKPAPKAKAEGSKPKAKKGK